jgi:hypothetical protein
LTWPSFLPLQGNATRQIGNVIKLFFLCHQRYFKIS